MNSKYYIYIAGVIIAVAIGIGAYMFFGGSDSAMKKFASGRPVAVALGETTEGGATTKMPAMFCPEPGSLVKDGVKWVSQDRKWETYTPSSATKIVNYIGAQWIGVRVGKIVCLYQTNEAVSFPVALEQTRSLSIVEPKSMAWSALVGNLRFCKSASVADCPFFLEPPKDTSNIYKEIEYAPDKEAVLQ